MERGMPASTKWTRMIVQRWIGARMNDGLEAAPGKAEGTPGRPVTWLERTRRASQWRKGNGFDEEAAVMASGSRAVRGRVKARPAAEV